MITLIILAPLGRILKLTDDYHKNLSFQASYTPDISVNSLINWLAEQYTDFKYSLSDVNEIVVQEMFVGVNGKSYSLMERELLLKDESMVEFIIPYTGG